MEKLLRLGVAWLLATVVLSALPAQEHARKKTRVPPDDLGREESAAVELYRKVLPTVVTIYTSRRVFTPEGPREEEGLGSGVLIPPDSHVLTAAHVVQGADHIEIKTQDGKIRRGELVYSEFHADIALVRLVTPAPELPHATLGDSDRLAVGQKVYVTGSPFGLENSFSVGHISGFHEFDRLYDGTILAEFIQTDAAINSGNSGGPVFDSKGRVIGIASWIVTQSGGFEGLSFAVAINTAKQLLALEDRPWIGIEAIFLDGERLAELFNLDREGGLLIQHVARGSPAERAGLRGGTVPAEVFGVSILLGGDLVLEFNAQEACHAECLIDQGKRLAGVERIPITFLRGGRVMHAVVDVSKTRRNFLSSPD